MKNDMALLNGASVLLDHLIFFPESEGESSVILKQFWNEAEDMG
jgi:hypothetical protein